MKINILESLVQAIHYQVYLYIEIKQHFPFFIKKAQIVCCLYRDLADYFLHLVDMMMIDRVDS